MAKGATTTEDLPHKPVLVRTDSAQESSPKKNKQAAPDYEMQTDLPASQ